MPNKKVQEFFDKCDAKTMKDLTRKNALVSDLLRKVNSQIIRDILFNARDYHHSHVVSTTRFLTADDKLVIEKLKEIGYNINVSKNIDKSGEWVTITIKFD